MLQAAAMTEKTGRSNLVLPPEMDEEGHFFDFISFFRWAVPE
jgi:hypothetical protein